MLNFVGRLFGREKQIDEATLAYIEGRAGDAHSRDVLARVAGSPSERADLESMRSTVAVLRAVQPARAPRSFVLHTSYAQKPASRPWYVQAPALGAAVAVLAVGVLVAADLGGALHQGSNGSRESGQSAEVAGAPASELRTAGRTGEPGAMDMVVTPDGAGAMQATAPEVAKSAEATAESPMSITAAAPAATAALPPQADSAPAPESTIVTIDSASQPYLPADQPAPTGKQAPAGSESGLSLPLWQIEAALLGVAVLMLMLWLALKRSSRSGT